MTVKDEDVLDIIRHQDEIQTYAIRFDLIASGAYGKGLAIDDVMSSCERLEADGKIKRAETPEDTVCWSVVLE